MARGRTQRPPTVRNLELYHEFVCEHKTQAEIAEEFELSQPRVAAVCRKVERWVEALISPAIEVAKSPFSEGKTRLDDGQKLHVAVAIRRLQLTQAYGKFLNEFGGTEVAVAFIPLLRLWDAGAIPKRLTALLPPRDLIRSAIEMAGELNDLECLAERGPCLHLPDQLLHAHGRDNQPATAPAISIETAPSPATTV
jgi:hypothetical protein